MSLEFVDKKSKKKIFIVILLIISLLILLGLFGFCLINKIKDPNNYLTSIKNNLVIYIDDYFDFFDSFNKIDFKKESKLTSNISFNTNEELDTLNNYNFDYTTTSSLDKEEIQMNLNILKNKNNILSGNIYLQKDSLFLESTDLYQNIIKIEQFDNIFSLLKESDILINKNVITKFIKYFFTSLSLANSKSEIIDLCKIKYIYVIDNSNISNINNKFLSLLKNDIDFNFLFLNGELKEEYRIEFIPIKIETLNNIITREILNIKISSDNYNLEVVKDNKDSNKYLLKENNNISYLYIKDSKISLNIYENDVLESKIEFSGKDDLFLVNLTDRNFLISLTLKEKELNTFLVSLKYESKINNENFVIDLDCDVKVSKNRLDFDLLTDFLSNDLNLGIIFNGNIIYDNDLLTPKVIKDSTDINSLTEEDKSRIIGKVLEKFNSFS